MCLNTQPVKLPLSGFLFLVTVFSATCCAKDQGYFNDLKWQERALKKYSPSYTTPATSQHFLRMLRWAQNSNRTRYAQIANEMYRNPGISKIMTEENYASLPSLPCLEQIIQLVADMIAGRTYAIYADDSNGREPSGYHRGDYLWLGKYYECKGQTGRNGTLVMKMCLSILTEQQNSTDGLYIGTCFPERCTEQDVSAYMEWSLNYTSHVTVYCPDKKHFTSGDIAAICIFSILAFFVLVGTVCQTVFICLDMYYVEENRTHEARKRSVPAYLLLCFSLIKNTKALMNTERKESNIAVLDGIRFLSMAWVILGHTLYFSLATVDNLLDVMSYSIQSIGGQGIINATFSVDSFFFLSGLLVTYLTLREVRRSGSLNIPVMYILRYLRLTPTLVLVMLFTSTLYMRIAEEPIFEVRNEILVEGCKNYWWTNVLYINNLYPETYALGCISWVWYLANDWQFFLLSPFFIYLLYKYPIPGFTVLGVVLVGSIATTGALSSHYELYPDVINYAAYARILLFTNKPRRFPLPLSSSRMHLGNISAAAVTPSSDYSTPSSAVEDNANTYFRDTYVRPWCRIGPYIIGIMAGYILFKTNKKFKINLVYVIQLWVAAFAVALALIYGWWHEVENLRFSDYPSVNLVAFYEAVKRPLWAFCLMWLTIACTIGYGGPINMLLKWRLFMPLSRLTFCAYLVHPLVLFYMFTAREVEEHLRINIFIYYFVAALLLSYMAAYVLHVLVEAPFSGLTKIIFYTPEGRKPWYSIFGINMKSGTSLADPNTDNIVPTNRGYAGENGSSRILKSAEEPALQPAYLSKNDEKNIAFENPVELADEKEYRKTNETDSSTAL